MSNDVLYYVCKYTPIELFEAFGTECKRLDPSVVSFDCADACAHPNLCGYGKGILEAVEKENVQALLVTDCCDVMRRVYDVLKASGKIPFLYFLPLPHKVGERETEWFAKELEKVRDAWTSYSGKEMDVQLLHKNWGAHIKQAQEAELSGEHIVVQGAHAGARLMDGVGARFRVPVLDQTCTGLRRLSKEGMETQGLKWYGTALLKQDRPCMRMQSRYETKEDADVLGVVYHTVKFCDYYSFDYHDKRKTGSTPLLKIETDCTPGSMGQLNTRLDAFAETLHVAKTKGSVTMKKNIRYVAGIDSGSTSTDAVIMDKDRKILSSIILPTGSGAAIGAEKALEQALVQAGLSREDLDVVVTTGYGRETIGLSDQSATEITCHAKGAHFLRPSARTVIDIGGQDSKVIRMDENGDVQNFIMNDKCAAGTGRFLDMMARTLQMDLNEMSRLGLEWKNDVQISSMCTVFAESEVVSLVAANTASSDIIHGLNCAVAGKTASLVKRLSGEPEFIMTGGVAQNLGVVAALEEKLKAKVYVPQEAQLCGAIGAALIAFEQSED